ncbi:hypothetical protein Scep_004391 [Stephania cephalantha]|uniref:Uncharacterized protein n=1 Tax=Stephania cephalantha TaxID=152367 RepID=A0AAP0KU64_9MAGN
MSEVRGSSTGISLHSVGSKYARQHGDTLLHPSLVTLDDIKEVKVLIIVLGADIDKISPPELVRIFKDVASPEGWTIRYDVENTAVVKRTEEAHQDMLDWFNKLIYFIAEQNQEPLGYFVEQ